MFSLHSYLILTVCFCAISSIQWTSMLDGQVIEACAGENVTIPWAFTLLPGEAIHSLQWWYSKNKRVKLVATMANGTFSALPAFKQRVQHLTNGGVVLLHVTKGDWGSYTIDLITNYTAGGSTEHRTVVLEVFDLVPATHGHQHVAQPSDVIQDKSGQQGSSGQTCGPCQSEAHSVLNDSRRDVTTGGGGWCDTSLAPGWYRFLLQGANAVMPTECVEMNHCTTHGPVWLDLQGQSPPAPGQQVQGRACGSAYDGCCQYPMPIAVRNCGGFLVYKLQPTHMCHLVYCAMLST